MDDVHQATIHGHDIPDHPVLRTAWCTICRPPTRRDSPPICQPCAPDQEDDRPTTPDDRQSFPRPRTPDTDPRRQAAARAESRPVDTRPVPTSTDRPEGSPPPSCPPSPTETEAEADSAAPLPTATPRTRRLSARQRRMLCDSICSQGQLELALLDTSPRPANDDYTPTEPPDPERPYDPIAMAQALHDHPELLIADLQWYTHGDRSRWCHGHHTHKCRLHHDVLLFLPNPPTDPPSGALLDLLPPQPPGLDRFRTLLETQSNHDLTQLNIWHTHRGWTIGGPNGSPFPPGFPPPRSPAPFSGHWSRRTSSPRES